MELYLLCTAAILGFLKVASTVWLVRQPDAKSVTDTSFGRIVYFASKISPALFIAAVLARSILLGDSIGFIIFCSFALAVAVIMAAVVVRKRLAGEWYGYAHDIRQQRQQRRRN